MLPGERRWGSNRRGGKILLGKISVPKPLNLPSQRLENHGLDPSVEIVPKGTISWGNHSSSSTLNAWGSPALSPTTDGGVGSPSHLNGRPSSSGSGTRPSTAGSDKSREFASNAWGASSRPSSASGVFTSSHSSLGSMRPHSAETRPTSSQLSRFAEPFTENSITRDISATAETLGSSSSKANSFTLTSGDFPTLGSENNSESNAQQAIWWERYGYDCPALQKFAIRVLSLTCSATSCERNWSVFDQIHSKRRNRLEQKRLNALVFVKYNLQLEQRQITRKKDNLDPICLSDLESDDEWITELEEPSLPQSEWTEVNECFTTQDLEATVRQPKKRRGNSSQRRPTSSSGGASKLTEIKESSPNDDKSLDANVRKGDQNTWRRDNSTYLGDGSQPTVENWQRDLQQPPHYHNANVPLQHFDPWNGAPIQNPPPDGIWFRGRYPPGPYGPAAPPGGYPLEPPPSYGYYHPKPLPLARPVSSSLPMPRPGPGPGGYHTQSVDSSHVHMPDSYVPTPQMIPVRYPGPLPPYDGYYGPPRMNLCNPNERDAPPVMAMPCGPGPTPCAYNWHSNQNVYHDSGNFHKKSGVYGPTSATIREQMEPGQAHEPCHHGPDKVRLKQRNGWGETEVVEKRVHSTEPPHFEQEVNQVDQSMREDNWELHCGKDVPVKILKSTCTEEASSGTTNVQGQSSVPGAQSLVKDKVVDGILMKEAEIAVLFVDGTQKVQYIKRNPALIDKIKGLNSKARISDGHSQLNQFRAANVSASSSINEVSSDGVSTELGPVGPAVSVPIASSNDAGNYRGEKSRPELAADGGLRPEDYDSVTVGQKDHFQLDRCGVHGVQGRAGYKAKTGVTVQESEEWRKKSAPGTDSSLTSAIKNPGLSSQGAPENQSKIPDKAGNEFDSRDYKPPENQSKVPGKAGCQFDSQDYKAQRAKIKEIVTHRAKQLQEEEEERAREQKAKALAKLDDLNRRTFTENLTMKSETNSIYHKQEKISVHVPAQTDSGASGELISCKSAHSSNAVTHTSKSAINKPGVSTSLPMHIPLETSGSDPHDSLSAVSSLPLDQDIDTKSLSNHAPSKQKQMGPRRKHNMLLEKNLGDKQMITAGIEFHVGTTANASNEPNPANSANASGGSFLQHKKKNITKNKHKVDEGLASVAMEDNTVQGRKVKLESVVSEASSFVLKEELVGRESSVMTADQGGTQPTEEGHGSRASNRWKSHSLKRMPRNTQDTTPAEKFLGNETVVWAPVRPPSKREFSEDNSPNRGNNNSLGRNRHAVLHAMKSKRTETEKDDMEPVAEELSRQGNAEHALSSLHPQLSDETNKTGLLNLSAVEKAGFEVETKNGEARHNRHVKTHASWRQRCPAKSSEQNCSEALISEKSSTDQKPLGQSSSKYDGHFSDGRTADKPVATESVTTKQHPSMLHRSNPADTSKDVNSALGDKTDSQPHVIKLNESDGKSSSITEKSHGLGEHGYSHWQPKPKAYSNQKRRASKGNTSQKFAFQVVRTPGKDISHQDQLQQPEKPNAAERMNAQGHELRREGMSVDLFKESQPGLAEQALENEDPHLETAHISPGMYRQGQNNRRFNRGGNRAPYGGDRGGNANPGQVIFKQQLPSTGDRRSLNNSHYEYQSIGSNHKPNSFHHHSDAADESSRDNPRGMGSRYQDRGRNHPRRGGHFHGRNDSSGIAVIAASHGNGE